MHIISIYIIYIYIYINIFIHNIYIYTHIIFISLCELKLPETCICLFEKGFSQGFFFTNLLIATRQFVSTTGLASSSPYDFRKCRKQGFPPFVLPPALVLFTSMDGEGYMLHGNLSCCAVPLGT